MVGVAVSRLGAGAELEADERLLDALDPNGPIQVRWYVPASPALVLGFSQRTRQADLLDTARCAAAGVAILERRAGGGLVLLDDGMLCLALALPRHDPRWAEDLTASYRWLGDALAAGLRTLGVADARRVEVGEARQDVAALRADDSPTAHLLLSGCFAALSPHEVVVGPAEAANPAKLVGLAQVRRRQGALFQAGLLLRDQRRLANYVRATDPTRQAFTAALRQRTVGLDTLLPAQALPEWIVSTLQPLVVPHSA